MQEPIVQLVITKEKSGYYKILAMSTKQTEIEEKFFASMAVAEWIYKKLPSLETP